MNSEIVDWRVKKRKENVIIKLFYLIFNFLFNFLMNNNFPLVFLKGIILISSIFSFKIIPKKTENYFKKIRK